LKPCPYCASLIDNSALQCPSCQRWLDPALDSTLNADSPPLVLPPRTTDGLAIASLVCGLFWIFGLGSVAAVILGYIALRQIRREPLRLKGKGMAITGISLGWLGILALAVLISLGIHFWKTSAGNPQKPRTQHVHLTTASLL
jgi:hypothetical protein